MLRRDLLLMSALFLFAGCPPSGAAGPEYSAAEGRSAAEGGDAPPSDADAIPEGPLPAGVTPTRYSLWLEVVPSRERFTGRVEIDVQLEEAQDLIWMHGAELNVTEVEVLAGDAEPVMGRFEQVDDQGVAALRLDAPVGPGEATLLLTYDAPFDRQLKGLYRVDTGGDSYAFTQFEATSARYAFPSFDEPRFKTPFEITLSVHPDHEAIANTTEVSRREIGAMVEHRFAPTERLPTYLVALAVGPLDIVEHDPIPPNDVRDRPIPLRGVAARGKGPQLAYALEHTAALLDDLETYFDIPYPYDKLDIIAVPDFASGAMENAGAITFRETLLLIDEDHAPENQRRWYAYVMAHELAHQWFGNLVTMPWWDDIWLNEAFATWMGNKTVQHVHPEYQGGLSMASMVHGAMDSDRLVSARQIRQPIETNHDIRNAFDSITYRKGGGVLSMFERWLGEDTFRDGIREHMNRHRFGTATADDLLDALSQTAGRDVGTPFRTFLEQPGVPLVTAERACDGDAHDVLLRQRRYLPVGSTGEADRTWQIPVCIRHGRGRATDETCVLLTEAEQRVSVGDACPDWIMPNADASGYYRWAMPSAEVDSLMQRGFSRLTARGRLSVADNLIAAYDADAVEPAAVFSALDAIAADDTRHVSTNPMGLLGWTRRNVIEPEPDRLPAFERFASGLYLRRSRRLGWAPRRGRSEDGETALMRSHVLVFLADTARVASVRREAAQRGRRYVGYGGDGEIHPDAVEPSLVGLALAVAVQDSDAAFFDALLEQTLESDDALFRRHALGALASTHDPELGPRALALSLEPRLRVNEVTIPITRQLEMRETRDAAFAWLREHFDEAFGRVATTRAGYAPWYFSGYCTEEAATEVEAFFAPRIESLPGGPRNLRGALEAIRLCAARVASQGEATAAVFD